MPIRAPDLHLRALAVHGLTASGAGLALAALTAAAQGAFEMMFGWLLAALAVDAVDGPLARRLDVRRHAPRLDGVILDLIVDYLTYVFIPAYALAASGAVAGWAGWGAAGMIVIASALYFADTRMKTSDASFNGFPACWNMVVLVILALAPPAAVVLAVVAALCVAMFLPLRFVHPVRTARWRSVTLPVAVIWLGLAGWVALNGFGAQGMAVAGLVAASGYLLLAGIAQQLLPARNPA